ncbi:hypothetical protein MTQ10_31095, partial [Streptomyces sp. XM83C]|nr:hypothetical protein [Streptomyces sp. XM83C]
HRTTVTRWVREVVGLLAARAPRLDRALKKIARKGGGVVLLDGVTSAEVVYRRPLGDLGLRLCGEFGGQGGVVGF